MARTLNLGIVAHVDAGKTSLTERLLHAAGVTDRVGRVDDGDTRTDTLALERRRGITIKAAVVAFTVGDVVVDLIDTPGHPDFVAEVERALAVLDGAVLVVSAVEGVQAQTRVLDRVLRRLGIPTLIFVNKVDRRGADVAGVLATLPPDAVAVSRVDGEGTPAACVRPADPPLHRLAEHDDALLAAYVEGTPVSPETLWAAVADQSRRGVVHPVLAGSAITGAGVDALLAALPELLPAVDGDPDAPASGTVFKVERGPGGERLADVRMWAGTLRLRERLPAGRVTGIAVFDAGAAAPADAVSAGRIAQVRGLTGARIGDVLGVPRAGRQVRLPPPTLETVVEPCEPGARGALASALTDLADQDPLIMLRRAGDDLAVSLYGEVQREVIAATLAEEYGVAATFRPTRTLCRERLTGPGEAAEYLYTTANPSPATVGLRLEPGPEGSGVVFVLAVEFGAMPAAYHTAVEETVRRRLQHGPRGWPVSDCVVTMTESGYDAPVAVAADFRALAAVVLDQALARAGTRVEEPVLRVRLDVPADVVGTVLPALARLGLVPRDTLVTGPAAVVTGEMTAARAQAVRRALPGLTRGEGVLEAELDHYRPVGR